MGTKNNPGKFDCYANAKPDEPLFVLLVAFRHRRSAASESLAKTIYQPAHEWTIGRKAYKAFVTSQNWPDKWNDLQDHERAAWDRVAHNNMG